MFLYKHFIICVPFFFHSFGSFSVRCSSECKTVSREMCRRCGVHTIYLHKQVPFQFYFFRLLRMCVCVLRESVCQCLCVCLSMCVCVWNNDKILFQLDHKQNQAWNATQFHRNRTKYSHWHICWHRSFTLLFAFASYFSFLLSHCVIPSIKNSHIDWVRVKHIDIMRVVGVTLYAIQLNAWWAFSRYASIKFSTITVFIWSVLSVCVCGCVRAPDIYRTGI